MKRMLSMFLVIAMVLSFNGFTVHAVAAEGDSIVATAQGSYTQSTEAQDITIRISTPGVTESYCTFGIDETVLPEGFASKSFATSHTDMPITEDDYNPEYGNLTYMVTNGDTIPAETYYDVVITAPANAVGDFDVTFMFVEVSKNGGTIMLAELEEVTTTITIAASSGGDVEDPTPVDPVNGDFKLSYSLADANGELSSANGGYYAANPGTVNATIYLESSKAWELQGYDIYVQASEKLTNATVSDFINGQGNVIATGDSTITRIQFLYEGDEGMNIPLTPNDEIAIATITYTIASDAVVYGDKLDISITNASAIAAESTPMGLKPTIDAAVKGVEITTQYDVTFDSQGGSAVEKETVGHGKTVGEPANPTKTGYTFSGWYDGNTEWNFATKITAEKTLTAKWTANKYTVTLNAGEHGSCAQENIQVTYGETYADLPTPTANSGYTFIGWFTGDDVQVKNADTVEITNDITLTAKYAGIKYYVTFNVNGGTGTVPTQKEVVYGEALELPTVSRDFYELLGWNTSAGATEALSADALKTLTTTAGSTVPLYAIWSDNAYTVKFVTGIEDFVIVDQKVVRNTPVTAPTDEMVKPGYTFEGWYNGNDLWDFDANVTDNMTLTAKWSLNTYTVTFMNGDVKVAEKTYTVANKTIEVPAVPTKDGYTSAWEPYNLDVLGNKTVKVIYTPIEYTVTFMNGNQMVTTKTYTVENKNIEVPAVPTKDGYTSAWEAYNLDVLGNKTVNAIFSVITYTITYKDGEATTTRTYTIEDAVTLLDDVAQDNYEVKTWKVTTAAGNWTVNDEIDAKAVITAGKFGNVTLTATDWESTIDFAVEAYAYALKGDALLIVSADGIDPATQHYTVNGKAMYYVEDSNYLNGSNEVFLYIVTPDVSDSALSFDANKLAIVDGAAETLDKSKGDVNGNGETDIGDANAVYQMLYQEAAGSYYNSYSKLSIKGRLIADMNTTAGVTHGSIEDVAKIVTLLNKV